MSAPSYHDIVVYVDGRAYRIADNFAYELMCTRVAGWQLYFHTHNLGGWPDTKVKERFGKSAVAMWGNGDTIDILIGGEFHRNEEFRIEVNGWTVCVGGAAGDDEEDEPDD